MYQTIFKSKNTQIEEYVSWRKSINRYECASTNERRWIEDFTKRQNIKELTDASKDNVRMYLQFVRDNYGTVHSYRCAYKALGCIFAHFHARNVPCLSRPVIYKVAKETWQRGK